MNIKIDNTYQVEFARPLKLSAEVEGTSNYYRPLYKYTVGNRYIRSHWLRT